MNTQRAFCILALAAAFAFGSLPAWGANRELVQLQTQVQALQDQMSRMQQTFDERMGDPAMIAATVLNGLARRGAAQRQQVTVAAA